MVLLDSAVHPAYLVLYLYSTMLFRAYSSLLLVL